MGFRDRIVVDPKIMVGKPVVRGARVPVELVLKRLAQDLALQPLLEAYPRLTAEDVQACLEYAQALVEREGREDVAARVMDFAARQNPHLSSDEVLEELERMDEERRAPAQ